jgi:hypothetical protein
MMPIEHTDTDVPHRFPGPDPSPLLHRAPPGIIDALPAPSARSQPDSNHSRDRNACMLCSLAPST